MKTHLDFVQYLPEWKIPDKYAGDKELLEMLSEDIDKAVKNFEAEIYHLRVKGVDTWKFTATDKTLNLDNFYICKYCEANSLNFLRSCVSKTLPCSFTVCLEAVVKKQMRDKGLWVDLIDFETGRKLRAHWLRQLETKLKGILCV